jgi:hypothetical protein
MRHAHTWGWARTRRYDGPSNELGPLSSHQSCSDCIIATPGYDFREGQGLKKVIEMDWETLIPGHPGPGGKQTGTKDNAREELAYLRELSAAVKQAVSEGKSYADAQKEIKLPKYEAWPNYNAFLPMNIERYYDFWNRGI